MKIWRKRLTYLLTELINDEAVCRTAPATPVILDDEALYYSTIYPNSRDLGTAE